MRKIIKAFFTATQMQNAPIKRTIILGFSPFRSVFSTTGHHTTTISILVQFTDIINAGASKTLLFLCNKRFSLVRTAVQMRLTGPVSSRPPSPSQYRQEFPLSWNPYHRGNCRPLGSARYHLHQLDRRCGCFDWLRAGWCISAGRQLDTDDLTSDAICPLFAHGG